MRKTWIVVFAVVIALLGAACGDDDDDTSTPAEETETGAGEELSGSIGIDGSSTVGPITEAIAEEFNAEQPDVKVAVGISGTGGGFEKFCRGETDMNDASRAIKDEEAQACQAKGVEFVELKVALDGLAVVANPGVNWTECLTMEQLKAIWDQGSAVKTWNQVDPKFPNQPMPLFGPGTDSGTFDYFTDEVNGEEGRSRTDYTPSEDDNVLVRGVSGQAGALGYFGVAYYEQNKDKLADLGVDKGSGCVKPNTETVQSGDYPLSRPLFVYVSKAALARPEVESFMTFYLETVNDVVADVGYVALPAADLEEATSALETALGS